MSSEIWVALIVLAGQIVIAVQMHYTSKMAHKTHAVVTGTEVKIEAVKAAVAATTATTTDVLALVNGSHGALLETSAISARLLHRSEPTEENRAKMNAANVALEKHQEREAMIAADKDKGRIYTQTSYLGD